MTCSIPHPSKKRALIIVDLQPGFVIKDAQHIVPPVIDLIENGGYVLFIEAVFHADDNSLWDQQLRWTFPLSASIPEITTALQNKDNIAHVIKTTKSTFQGDKNILELLKVHQIEEVHIVGMDTEDCVLATAFDSFDAGFFTYVIEECTESSNGSEYRDFALKILRNVNMTNHSV